jgi:hypothetical protein
MAGIDRIDGGGRPAGADGGSEIVRRETPRFGRNQRTNFAQGLTTDATRREPGPSGERDSSQRYLSDGEWARQRTLEELKTLVQAIQSGVTDPWQLTDLIFYARHPDMIGQPLTKEQQPLLDEWNAISALLVHPAINEVSDFVGANVIGGDVRGARGMETAFERATGSPVNEGRFAGGSTRSYDSVIARAVEFRQEDILACGHERAASKIERRIKAPRQVHVALGVRPDPGHLMIAKIVAEALAPVMRSVGPQLRHVNAVVVLVAAHRGSAATKICWLPSGAVSFEEPKSSVPLKLPARIGLPPLLTANAEIYW